METLEQTRDSRNKGDMCINHYRAMTSIVITEEEVKDRNCDGYNPQCPRYKPAKNYQVLFNAGINAVIFGL